MVSKAEWLHLRIATFHRLLATVTDERACAAITESIEELEQHLALLHAAGTPDATGGKEGS